MTWKASAVSWKSRRGLAVSTVSRCGGVIEGFDGAIEGATVSYRLCHRRFDGACRFRRCHRRCGGVIKGFDGVIEASSGVRVPPQVRAGSRMVRTDLARKFATAASIDQILFSIVVVSVSSRVVAFSSPSKRCGAELRRQNIRTIALPAREGRRLTLMGESLTEPCQLRSV